MMDKKDIAKSYANSQISGLIKQGKRASVKIGAADFADEIQEITRLCADVGKMEPDQGDALEQTLESMPVVFNTIWNGLANRKPVTVYEDQAEAFASDLGKFLTRTREWHKDVQADYRKRRAAQRTTWEEVQCESGTVYVPRWKLQLLTGNLKRGVHTLLKGPPGSGKTEVGRAAAGLIGWTFFHMEVSGFTDVSQLEYERVILAKDGASYIEMRPTALTLALQAVQAGEKVVLYIDEIKRVGDPSILNPFLLLLAQGEYHSVVTKDVYRVSRDNFVVLASANDAAGFNFSGNNRKGMDDALSNRFDEMTFELPSATLMASDILPTRYPGATRTMLRAVGSVYGICQKGAVPHFNTRDAFRLMNAWEVLGGEEELDIEELLRLRFPGDKAQLDKVLQELSALGV